MAKDNNTDYSGALKILRAFLQALLKGENGEEKPKKRGWLYLIAILGLLAAGFFTGRSTIKAGKVETIKYLPGDTTYVYFDNPPEAAKVPPVYISRPVDTASIIADCIRSGKFEDMFPGRDTVIITPTKEDTTAVLIDWATERVYEKELFNNDTAGVVSVRAKTQYNRLEWLDAMYVPVTKQVTVTQFKTKKYSPFISGGVTTMPEIVVNGGVYFNEKYSISAMYEYDWANKKSAFGVMGGIKF